MVRMAKMRITKLVVLTLTLLLLAQAETKWEVVKTFPIGGVGGWDYLTMDSVAHRLYVPRTTHTMVIDTDSGAVVGDIPGQKNAHGVALAAGRGYISDGGGDGAIVIFDLSTNEVIGSLPAMPDADGIVYDLTSNRILVVSGRGKTLMMFPPNIDPSTGKIEDRISLRGEPEFLATDSSGKAYINLMDTHEVAVIDLKAKRVAAHWPVAPGGKPVGMALDLNQDRLFIGCRGPQKFIVMSTGNGKVLSHMPIGESVDAVKLYRNQAFASTAGSLFVADEVSPGKFAITQTVKTNEGSKTMAVDLVARQIYLPAAEYEVGANGKRTAKPGTFKILVVAPK
jgi:hypothetical protein